MHTGRIPAEKAYPEVKRQLIQIGFDVLPLTIDVKDYKRYLERARYPAPYIPISSPSFPEKTLEHYLAFKLLNLRPFEIYVDIASAGSPVPEIYRNLSGCKTYRQDLVYPPGIHGNKIGCDASDLPLPDSSVDAMALHCSFEHFEGSSDIGFIEEATRVLRPGGRLCILPLYMFNKYAIMTDPNYGFRPSEDADVYVAEGWGEKHGRFYDAAHLVSRIRDHLRGLRLTIYEIQNANEVHPYCYLKFVAFINRGF